MRLPRDRDSAVTGLGKARQSAAWRCLEGAARGLPEEPATI